jgi:hypothetical protein
MSGQIWAPAAVICWIGNWMNCRTAVHVVAKRNPCPCRESNLACLVIVVNILPELSDAQIYSLSFLL